MQIFRYYLRDARQGIRRNAGASAATVLLIFLSLSITGSSFLFKTSLDEVIRFLNTQVTMKLFLDESVDPWHMAQVLESKSFVETASVETREQTLNRLKEFFQGKDYLFLAFQESDFPHAVTLRLADNRQADLAANELESLEGVTEVIYPQRFAKTVLNWSNVVNRYGALVLLILFLASLLTVGTAINLGIYQRQKDIRVKLLLGAKESHVRGQFLFEGWLLGLMGSILASFVIYIIFQYALLQLELRFSQIFDFQSQYLNMASVALILAGSLIGLLGSYWSTRGLIKNA